MEVTYGDDGAQIPYRDPHVVLGLIVFIMMWLQIILGTKQPLSILSFPSLSHFDSHRPSTSRWCHSLDVRPRSHFHSHSRPHPSLLGLSRCAHFMGDTAVGHLVVFRAWPRQRDRSVCGTLRVLLCYYCHIRHCRDSIQKERRGIIRLFFYIKFIPKKKDVIIKSRPFSSGEKMEGSPVDWLESTWVPEWMWNVG